VNVDGGEEGCSCKKSLRANTVSCRGTPRRYNGDTEDGLREKGDRRGEAEFWGDDFLWGR